MSVSCRRFWHDLARQWHVIHNSAGVDDLSQVNSAQSCQWGLARPYCGQPVTQAQVAGRATRAQRNGSRVGRVTRVACRVRIRSTSAGTSPRGSRRLDRPGWQRARVARCSSRSRHRPRRPGLPHRPSQMAPGQCARTRRRVSRNRGERSACGSAWAHASSHHRVSVCCANITHEGTQSFLVVLDVNVRDATRGGPPAGWLSRPQ